MNSASYRIFCCLFGICLSVMVQGAVVTSLLIQMITHQAVQSRDSSASGRTARVVRCLGLKARVTHFRQLSREECPFW